MTLFSHETQPDSFSDSSDSHRLWMERGFSRREIAPRMMDASPDLTIISSTLQPVAGTEAFDLPLASSSEAIERINLTIKDQSIDALWVQDSAKYDLSAIDAQVHAAASPETVQLVDDKTLFNEWLGDDIYRPFSFEVVGVDAVREAFERRRYEGHEVCIKPVFGVNGEGYWRLSDSPKFSLLNRPEARVIHPDTYLNALAHQEAGKGPKRMVLMDYLPGPEVSVDLLTWNGEPLSHAARTKLDQSHQRIESEHEVIAHTHMLAKKLGFHGIISLQYRLDVDSNWKILEINPRPAGGSIHSEDAGFEIITNWAKLLTGEITPSDVQQIDGTVLHKKRVNT
jgi:hypothetical protein